MSKTVKLSSLIYPASCVLDAISVYSAICTVDLHRETLEALDVEISVREDIEDKDRAVSEFLNYLLDLSLDRYLTNPRI